MVTQVRPETGGDQGVRVFVKVGRHLLELSESGERGQERTSEDARYGGEKGGGKKNGHVPYRRASLSR